MYDTGNFYLLVKTREEEFGSQTLDLKKPARLRLIKSDHFDVADVIPAISIPEEGPVYLRVTTTQEGLYAKFFYSLDGKDYQELAEVPSQHSHRRAERWIHRCSLRNVLSRYDRGETVCGF